MTLFSYTPAVPIQSGNSTRPSHWTYGSAKAAHHAVKSAKRHVEYLKMVSDRSPGSRSAYRDLRSAEVTLKKAEQVAGMTLGYADLSTGQI